MLKFQNNLALDIGFRNTGWVLFQGAQPIECGCIQTVNNEFKLSKSKYKKIQDNIKCSIELAFAFDKLLVKYTPDLIIGEMPTGGGKSSTAIIQMHLAGSIIALIAKMRDIPCEWTTPKDGKIVLTGNKFAKKDDMMDAVRALYPTFDWPKTKKVFEHVADSVAAYEVWRKNNETQDQ